MGIFFILFAGVVGVMVGRLMFGRWFNHVGVYSAIWSFSLAVFELRLIRYFALESETWILILGAWIAFVVGSATVFAARYALGLSKKQNTDGLASIDSALLIKEQRLLHRILWVCNVITLMDAIHKSYLVTSIVGNVLDVLVLGNLLYSFRVSEGIPGAIPYLGSLALSATLLAGAYTSLVGKVRLVALLPLLGVIFISILTMSRAQILIAAILFLTGYHLNHRRRLATGRKQRVSKYKRAAAIVFSVVLLVVGAEVVRSNRGTFEGFAGATSSLRKLGGASFITPSIVLYLTVHHGVLDQYLKKDVEHVRLGNYSFAPVWRLLSKLGFDTYVQQYQPFYLTPVKSNTGTYLRELHADYGLAGVMIGPYVLGLVSSWYWCRNQQRGTLTDLTILGHIYVVVAMSFLVMATQLGYWLMSFLSCLVISFWHDKKLGFVFWPSPGWFTQRIRA